MNQRKINEIYTKWAKDYDKNCQLNPAIKSEKDYLIRLLDLNKKDILLDLGCGTGRYIKKLHTRTSRIIGIDNNDAMLNICKSKILNLKNIELLKSDIEKKLPLQDSSVSKCIASLSISHVKNILFFFEEVKRVLKEEGIFVLSTFCEGLEQPFITKFKDYINECYRQGININYRHSLCEIIRAVNSLNLKIGDIIITKIDKTIKNCITPVSYEKNKNKPFLVILSIRKNDFSKSKHDKKPI